LLTAFNRQKWKEDISRRLDAEKRLAYYNYKQKQYVKDLITKRIDSNEAITTKNYIECEDFTKQIIDDISLIFKNPVDVELKDAETQSKNLQRILNRELFNPKLTTVNKVVNLANECGVVTNIRNNEVKIDIITPNNMFVVQNEDDPTEADLIAYQVGILENSQTASRVDIYNYWTKDGKYSCKVNLDNGFIYDIEKIEDVPKYGRIPVVIFRNYVPINRFFKDEDSSLVAKNEEINYARTRLNLLRDFNIPIKVSHGLPEGKGVKTGVTHGVDFPYDIESGAYGDLEFKEAKSPVTIENDLNHRFEGFCCYHKRLIREPNNWG